MVSQERYLYGLLHMTAEVGGYVGVLLGVSARQGLWQVVSAVFDKSIKYVKVNGGNK